MDKTQSDLNEMCNKLQFSQIIREKALQNSKLFYDFYNSTNQDDYSEWLVCFIYIAFIESRHPYGFSDHQFNVLDQLSMTASDILRMTCCRVQNFLKKMKILKDSSLLNGAVTQHLSLIECKFLIACPLYIKFEKMFKEIFALNAEFQNSKLYEEKKEVCWCIFTFIRATIQQKEGTLKLAVSFHLLLCCLEYIIRLTPSYELNPPFDAVRILSISNQEGDIIQELCNIYQALLKDVRLVQQNYFDPEFQRLPIKDDIIDLTQIIDKYTGQCRTSGDINELDFLKEEYYLTLKNEKLCELSKTQHNIKKSQKCEHTIFNTPIRYTMQKIQSLHKIFGENITHPTSLSKYFKNSTLNLEEDIKDRLNQYENIFIGSYCSQSGAKKDVIARERFQMAICIYYNAMESLLKIEEDRLKRTDFTSLLIKDIFHKSLLSCSLEIVLFTYESSSAIESPKMNKNSINCFTFPWILSVFNLTSFDFFRVVDSFIKAKPNLISVIKNHLNTIEEDILEELAWKSDSSIFGILLNSTSEPLSNRYRINTENNSIEFSPRNQIESIIPIFSESHSPIKSRSLSLFFNKVFMLGFQKLKVLFSKLNIPTDLQFKIKNCLEYCVQSKPNLLRDRHLDQILMCCIYSVSKIQDFEIKFKEIMDVYISSYPSSSTKLIKNVLISNNERGPIINFYNQVFIQEVKDYLFRYSNNLKSSNSPNLNINCDNNSSPVYRIPTQQIINVSPMNYTLKSPFKVPLTPKTKVLYSFGSSPLSSLKVIKESKSASSTPIKGIAMKKLKFEIADASNEVIFKKFRINKFLDQNENIEKELIIPNSYESKENKN